MNRSLNSRRARINADLTVGVDVTSAIPLKANDGLCSPGVKLHGSGFIVTAQEAEHLGLGKRSGLDKHIRQYRNGRDLTSRPRGVMVIDLFGLEADDVRRRFPEVYQHVLATVKPERDGNNRESYRDNWWIFGEPRSELRPALLGLRRYIATVETSQHRFFQSLGEEVLPDNRLVCFAFDDAYEVGVLSAASHIVWTLASGGTLEDRPIYTKTRCFDPFPFPDCDEPLKAHIRAVAEELDAFRKARQREHPRLTLTQMYNVLEKLKALSTPLPNPPPQGGREQAERAGRIEAAASVTAVIPGRADRREPGIQNDIPSSRVDSGSGATRRPGMTEERPALTADEERIKDEGLILILKELHERLDRLVFQAYGWPETLTDEQILEKLVALNHERAAEEKRGLVRWLRPDYQIPRFGRPVDQQAATEEGAQIAAALAIDAPTQKPAFPTGAVEQTAAVFSALAAARGPLDAANIATGFKGRNVKKKVAAVLMSLARLGHLATKDGQSFQIRGVA